MAIGFDYNTLLEANRETEEELLNRNLAELEALAEQGRGQFDTAANTAGRIYKERGSPAGEVPTINPNNPAYGDYLKTRDEYEKLKARMGQASPYSYYIYKEQGLDPANMPDAFGKVEEEAQRKLNDLALGAQRDRDRKAQNEAFWKNQADVKAGNQQNNHKMLVDELKKEIDQWWTQTDEWVKRDNLFGDLEPPAWLKTKWQKAANALGISLPAWATGRQTYKSENPQVLRGPWADYDSEQGKTFNQDPNQYRQEFGVFGMPTGGSGFQDYATPEDKASGNVRDWSPTFYGWG